MSVDVSVSIYTYTHIHILHILTYMYTHTCAGMYATAATTMTNPQINKPKQQQKTTNKYIPCTQISRQDF